MPTDLELIRFWPVQMSQHCLFMQLGLNSQDLKDEAADLHSDWENFISSIPRNPDPTELTDAMDQAKSMCATLRDYKSKVFDLLISGEWEGWLFPSFISHIRAELDYFAASISGQQLQTGFSRASNELCTWLRFASEHAAFAAHLLDPTERMLFKQALALQEKLEDLEDGCKSMEQGFIGLSLHAGELLDKYFTTSGIGMPSVRSVIHPVLALHVVREGRMFLRTLQELRGETPTFEIPE